MKTVQSALAVAGGNLLYALAVTLFLVPADLVTGGSTGIALVVEHLWGVSMPLFLLLFNGTMLLFGWLILGRGFALTTLASTFLYPLALELCGRVFGGLVLTEDMLLCTIFSGLGIGASLGLVIRAGASTGGMDIPPLVLKKLAGVPVSVSLYAFDFVILLLQVMIRPAENVLYGIVLVLIYTVTLDKMLLIGKSRTELKIISEKARQISGAILTQVDRGVTLLYGEGGYLHGETELILSVISNRELIRVEKIVHEIDPDCFMVVSRVSEVRGRGFSAQKEYR